MSEKQKEKPWQDEISEIVNREVKKALQSQITQTPPSSEKLEHKTAQELADCPNCHKTYQFDEYNAKLSLQEQQRLAKALKERQANRELKFECDDCGTKVDPGTETECPTCRGTKAHPRTD